MPTIAGQNVTKKAHDAIVSRVLEIAEDRGYCSEVEDFMDELGFVIPTQTATVTIEVKVTRDSRNTDLTSEGYWNIYHDVDTVDDWKVVSVK